MATSDEAINAYAWEMVLSGAEHAVQDDMNEEGELDDDQWREALKRAKDLLWAFDLLAEEIGVAASMREYWEGNDDLATRRAVVMAAFGEPIPLDTTPPAGDPQP